MTNRQQQVCINKNFSVNLIAYDCGQVLIERLRLINFDRWT